MLCNAADAEATTLGRKVAELFLPIQESTATNARPAQGRNSLAGVYAHSRTGFPLTLRATEQGLRASTGEVLLSDGNSLQLGELTLTTTDDGLRLTSPLGTVVDEYRKVEAPSRNNSEYTGTYVSDEIGMTYFVIEEDGRLFLRFDRRPSTNIPLVAAYKDAFAPGNILIRFYRDKNGRVTELSLAVARLRDLRARRISAR